MDENFWINVHRILVYIRADIKKSENVFFLESILKCIINKDDTTKLCNLLNGHINLVSQLEPKSENMYVDANNISQFWINILEKVIQLLKSEDYQMALEAVDAIHILPELMLNYDKKSLKKYWKVYIKNLSNELLYEFDFQGKKYFF